MKKTVLLLITLLLITNLAFAEGEMVQTMTLKLTVPDRTISIYTGEHISVQIGETLLKEDEGLPVQVSAPRLENIGIQLVADEDWSIDQVTFDAGEASVGSYDAETAVLSFVGILSDEIVHISEIDEVTDWQWQDNEDGETCVILKYIGSDMEVTVPQTIHGRTVTSLADGTFAGYTEITKVSIPYTVAEIAENCFDADSNICIACHEDSAAHLFAEAQGFAIELESHTGTPAGCITEGHCDICGMTLIPTGHEISFEHSVYETNIGVPVELKIISVCGDDIGPLIWTGAENGLFTGNEAGFYTVTASTEDGYTAAIKCSVVVHAQEAIHLPDMLQTIDAEAFMGSTQITEVILPEKCSEIESKAFADCAALKIVIFPDTPVEIADDAFAGCESGMLFICGTQDQADYAEAKGFNYILKPVI